MGPVAQTKEEGRGGKSVGALRAGQRSFGSENSLAVQLKRRPSGLSQKLAVPSTAAKHRQSQPPAKRRSGSIASGSSGGSSGGSRDGSDAAVRRRHRHKKSKRDNALTRLRDAVAESDVFLARRERAPYVVAVAVTLLALPPLLLLLLWDTLAVAAFQIPHLSTINVPVFLLEFHFICIMLAMYGYSVQVLVQADHPRTSLASISLCAHLLLFTWRVFLELYFDGYRGQIKHYVPRPGSDTMYTDDHLPEQS